MLTQFDLFEAAETGDVATFQRFFAQPTTLQAALALEAAVTDAAVADLSNRFTSETALIPTDAWVYLHDRRRHVFHIAIQHGQYAVIEWLFTSPLSTELLRTLQFFLVDAATTAILQRDIGMLDLLLASPAWIQFPATARPDALSAFLKAGIERLHGPILNLLVAHGADMNRPMPGQGNPLTFASARDPSNAVVSTLRDLGAFTVGDGSALHSASEYGHRNAIATLLELGVDPRAVDRQRNTALHRAAEEGFCTTVTELLESVILDIDAQNADGDTALNIAVKENPFADDDEVSDDERDEHVYHPQVIEILLEHGANPEICSTGDYEYAPLHWAVGMRCVGVVRCLLTHGADANGQSTTRQQTPVHKLSLQDEDLDNETLEMLELLVQHGADLKCEDADGVVPLDFLRESDDGREWLTSHSFHESYNGM